MSELIVADKYRMQKLNGKFDRNTKQLVRKGMKVLPNYVEDQNSQDNDVLFVIDHEATEQLRKAQAEKADERKVVSAKAKLNNAEIVDILVSAKAKENNGAKQTANGPLSDDDLSLKELKEKYKEFGIKARSKDEFLFELKQAIESKGTENESGQRRTTAPVED